MAEFTLNTNNIADVAHTWHRGTIAIDTAGDENFITQYIPEGYSFAGMKIHLGNIHDIQGLEQHPVDIVIRNANGEYKQITRTVSLTGLVESFINIEVRFSFKDDFTSNSIPWNDVEELEEDEEDE